jgi:hypothetical protein
MAQHMALIPSAAAAELKTTTQYDTLTLKPKKDVR